MARLYSMPATSAQVESVKPKERAPSSVLHGTPLEGLNVYKGKKDPVALRDDEYPEWLWTLLDPKPTGLSKRKHHSALRDANRSSIKSLNFIKNRKT
ncbi:MAG: mitochondrial 54S ribosomal protein YmL37 [Piptocephalis tieghemiana]|nr:MAG: mitochondrial 54S ribosomal protein YmL37 [Piptocephalis tieghemiana]